MQNLMDFNHLLELPKDVLPRIYFKNKDPLIEGNLLSQAHLPLHVIIVNTGLE